MYYYLSIKNVDCICKIENISKKITNYKFGDKPVKLYRWTRIWGKRITGNTSGFSISEGLFSNITKMFMPEVTYSVHPRHFKSCGFSFLLEPDSGFALGLLPERTPAWLGARPDVTDVNYKIICKAKSVEAIIKKHPDLFDDMLSTAT